MDNVEREGLRDGIFDVSRTFDGDRGGSRLRALVFLRFALDSDPREPLLLVAARPISGASAPLAARGGGFRRADDFEVVRARDRSRLLEYGVTKTQV